MNDRKTVKVCYSEFGLTILIAGTIRVLVLRRFYKMYITHRRRNLSGKLNATFNGAAVCVIRSAVRGAQLSGELRDGPSRGAPTHFMVTSGGVLSEGFMHGGPGVCLGDGQTEAEGIPSQGGRGDALFRRPPPHLI